MALNHTSVKQLSVIGITLGLMIPLSQVERQISSRKDHEEEAEKQVAKGWGSYVDFHSASILTPSGWIPSSHADTSVLVETQEKKKGVFKFPVYQAILRTKVKFQIPARAAPEPRGHKPFSDRVVLQVYPINAVQRLSVRDSSGKELKARLMDDGIRVELGDRTGAYSEELDFEVVTRGTGPVTYKTTSDQDTVKMSGNWTKPKFHEDLLPDQTKLGPQGFEASWQLQALPGAVGASRETKEIGMSNLRIGADYGMIERATKYGVLFITLTFLLVLIVEFVGRVGVHPLQYGLIGAAISIFYLLLLAISEQAGFDWAYLISSTAVTALIVAYAKGFVKSPRYVRLILGEQVLLSGFFYTLLSLEERALLTGSIGLFMALAAFMLGTRKVDWYGAPVTRS